MGLRWDGRGSGSSLGWEVSVLPGLLGKCIYLFYFIYFLIDVILLGQQRGWLSRLTGCYLSSPVGGVGRVEFVVILCSASRERCGVELVVIFFSASRGRWWGRICGNSLFGQGALWGRIGGNSLLGQ